MPYEFKFADVTKFDGDAILNSLGKKGLECGSLCRAILKAINNEQIINTITGSNRNYGDMFITDSGDMPCKKVINYVTPVRWEDDENCTNLKQAYTDVIELAIKEGLTSIALPFIGCGANGYDPNDVYKAVTYACVNLVDKEEKLDKDLLSITVISFYNRKQPQDYLLYTDGIPVYDQKMDEFRNKYFKSTIKLNMVTECCALREYHQSDLERLKEAREDQNFLFESDLEGVDVNTIRKLKYTDSVYRMGKEMAGMHSKDFFFVNVDYYDYKVPAKFIFDYLDYKGIDDKILNEVFHSRQMKFKVKMGEHKLTKMDVYRVAFLLDMSETVLREFMTIAGFSFSPISSLDRFVIEYMKNNYEKWGKKDSLAGINNLASIVHAYDNEDEYFAK